jgi:hypothetical protein
LILGLAAGEARIVGAGQRSSPAECARHLTKRDAVAKHTVVRTIAVCSAFHATGKRSQRQAQFWPCTRGGPRQASAVAADFGAVARVAVRAVCVDRTNAYACAAKWRRAAALHGHPTDAGVVAAGLNSCARIAVAALRISDTLGAADAGNAAPAGAHRVGSVDACAVHAKLLAGADVAVAALGIRVAFAALIGVVANRQRACTLRRWTLLAIAGVALF